MVSADGAVRSDSAARFIHVAFDVNLAFEWILGVEVHIDRIGGAFDSRFVDDAIIDTIDGAQADLEAQCDTGRRQKYTKHGPRLGLVTIFFRAYETEYKWRVKKWKVAIIFILRN